MFDEKGNVYFVVTKEPITPPVYDNQLWVMTQSGEASKLGDMPSTQTTTCVQTSPTTSLSKGTSFGPMAYNPAPQVRAFFLNSTTSLTTFPNASCIYGPGVKTQTTLTLLKVKR